MNYKLGNHYCICLNKMLKNKGVLSAAQNKHCFNKHELKSMKFLATSVKTLNL